MTRDSGIVLSDLGSVASMGEARPETQVLDRRSRAMSHAEHCRRLKMEVKRQERREALVPPGAMVMGIDLSRDEMVWHALGGEDGPRRAVGFTGDRTWEGVRDMVKQARPIAAELGCSEWVFAMEPTGSYWLPVAEALHRAGERYVVVPAVFVKRTRELEDGRPQAADPKDARRIADLARQRKVLFVQPQEEAGWRRTWYEIAAEYYDLGEAIQVERHRLRSWTDISRPVWAAQISDLTGSTALAVAQVLRQVTGEWDERRFLEEVRKVYSGRRFPASVARRLWPEVHQPSEWGCSWYREGLDWRISLAAERLAGLLRQQAETEARMMPFYEQSPEARFLDTIQGNPRTLTACVMGLAGDPHDWDSPRALVKMAGLDPQRDQSGRWRGETHVSRKGQGRLRGAAYRAAAWLCGLGRNPFFTARYWALRRRTENPLRHREAVVACADTYLRMLVVMAQKELTYREYCHFAHIALTPEVSVALTEPAESPHD